MSDDWVKRALTRKTQRKGTRSSQKVLVTEPDARIVYRVKFAIGMTACLSAIEVAHLVVLGVWNSEVFASITG